MSGNRRDQGIVIIIFLVYPFIHPPCIEYSLFHVRCYFRSWGPVNGRQGLCSVIGDRQKMNKQGTQ